jgi:hypothetical protein
MRKTTLRSSQTRLGTASVRNLTDRPRTFYAAGTIVRLVYFHILLCPQWMGKTNLLLEEKYKTKVTMFFFWVLTSCRVETQYVPTSVRHKLPPFSALKMETVCFRNVGMYLRDYMTSQGRTLLWGPQKPLLWFSQRFSANMDVLLWDGTV